MGISTGCNLACHFCYGVPQGRQGFEGRDGKMILMPLKVIKEVFSDAKKIGVRSIALIGEAENTLNPDLYPACEYSRDIGLDVSLATHGANFREEHVEPLLTSLQWIRINISAATPESYMRVHQRPWLERVIKGTELLVKGKSEKNIRNGKGVPTSIGYQMVLTDRNLDQVIPLAKLGRDMGIDYTVIKSCSDTPDGRLGAPHEKYLELADVFKKAETYSTDNYKVIVRWDKLGNMGNKEYGTCHGTRFIIALSGDGTLFPCGHWFAIERDRFKMGDVYEKSLSEIVRSERYWEVQNEIHKVDLRYCETNCRQHAINKTLDNIMSQSDPVAAVDMMEVPSGDILHENFI
jgi:radical SAM protein with 4Fe4S-binding SPASM domain